MYQDLGTLPFDASYSLSDPKAVATSGAFAVQDVSGPGIYGIVAGYSTVGPGGPPHATLWGYDPITHTKYVEDLGTAYLSSDKTRFLGSSAAYGMNYNGVVVGWSDRVVEPISTQWPPPLIPMTNVSLSDPNARASQRHAFAYYPNGFSNEGGPATRIDLNGHCTQDPDTDFVFDNLQEARFVNNANVIFGWGTGHYPGGLEVTHYFMATPPPSATPPPPPPLPGGPPPCRPAPIRRRRRLPARRQEEARSVIRRGGRSAGRRSFCRGSPSSTRNQQRLTPRFRRLL